ncbi:FkbM family methyltransferase [Actinotalea subterranea]|uniref:FkbM family methyltransferase n=1 Tax=Actinotalea subterranea TaxID=2607497 RepID=UPI0011EE64DC|nr:FkbM family methyltransferase [Actinotalea subterranea]
MTVTSYAQNFEDVLLWRALRHVVHGTYVDVGAGHPVHNNVTKLFYDAGWSGINIEPLPNLAEALLLERPRDVSIQAAVSSQDVEEADLTIVDVWDELSTMSTQRAAELRAEGRAVTTATVPVVRLDEVIAANGLAEIHFLKVDVEGAELDVLHTVDLAKTRPWVVVVEVVSGGGDANPREAIRAELTGNRYRHAYFDGLNDFYVAEERASDVLPSFGTPVNVTDDFVLASGGAHVVDLIGEKVGMTPPTQTSEVLQRVEAVVRDRVAFESEGLAARERLTVLEAELERALGDVRGWRLKAETMEQTSFERERMVAWYAAEVSNLRGRSARQAQLIARQEEELDRLRVRMSEVFASTSWRLTMPVRAARRPRTYLRKFLGR